MANTRMSRLLIPVPVALKKESFHSRWAVVAIPVVNSHIIK